MNHIPHKIKLKLDKLHELAKRPGTVHEGLTAMNIMRMLGKKHNINVDAVYKMPNYKEHPLNQRIIHLDFETYSAAPLGDVGSWIYANHHSTRFICLSWAYNDDEPHLWSPHTHSHEWPYLKKLFERIQDGWDLYAWNAQFEYYMWNYCGVDYYNWPKVPLEQFQDVQALALSLALPANLGACGEALDLDIQKDKSGKRLINKLSKPRKPTKYNPDTRWSFEDAKHDYLEMFQYCKQDVRSETEIYNTLPIKELPGYERDLWLATVRINEKGVPVDIDTVRNLKYLLGQYESKQVKRLAEITGGHVTTAGQLARMKKWFIEYHGIEVPNMTADTVAEYLANPDIPQPVKDVMSIRRMMSRTSTKKFNRIVDMVDDNGYVHDIIRYHIATTGRWGGSGLQVHNLPNARVDDPDLVAKIARQRKLSLFLLFYDDIMYVGSAMIRPIVRAKLGFKLYVSDFSSIENRFTCWLAGDEESLKLFRMHLDQYKWFATKLYDIPYDAVNKHQRTHAKTCILGLGYGMGVDKFYETCVSYGFDITYEECKRSVELYREIFHKIVDLWYKSYECAMHTVLTGEPTQYIHLKFIKEKDFLFMELPSGRRIAYHKPRVEPVTTPWGETRQGITFMGQQPYTRKWGRLKLIPGRLIENAAQGGARDVMAEAKLRLIERGYRVIFSVHDEIVSHDPVDFGSLEEYDRIMCDTNQTIYPGLPIDSEGFVTNRYRKG